MQGLPENTRGAEFQNSLSQCVRLKDKTRPEGHPQRGEILVPDFRNHLASFRERGSWS